MLLATAAAQWSILGNYFYEDDFMHFYQIANYGFLAFLVFSQGGHFYLVRNFLFWAMHEAFGVQAMPYFAVALATHLLNAALFYLVVVRQSRDRWLAAAVASLWGTCLASRGTIGWYSVYGHALAVTALLAALLLISDPDRPPSWRRLFAVAAAVGTGAMCFGDGLAVGLVFWAIALLRFHEAASRKRALVVFGGLAVVLPVLYVLYLAAGPFVFGQALPGAAPEASASDLLGSVQSLTLLKLQMVGYLTSAGIGALLLGDLDPQAQLVPVHALTVPAAAVVAAIAAWQADAEGRRRLAAWFIVSAAAYGMIAVGRTMFCLMSRIPLEVGGGAPRYHYLAQVGLAGMLGACLSALLPREGTRLAVLRWVAIVVMAGLAARNVDRGWLIAPERSAESWVTASLSRVRQTIAQARGPVACIPNQGFPPVTLSAVDPRIFPGTAALYVSWFADDSLDGRRVYFTEPNVELRRQIASLPAARIRGLLVAPENCPPRRAGATTRP